MSDVLEMPAEELLERLEEAAAEGVPGAERELAMLLDVWAETGELSVLDRLAARRYLRAERR